MFKTLVEDSTQASSSPSTILWSTPSLSNERG